MTDETENKDAEETSDENVTAEAEAEAAPEKDAQETTDQNTEGEDGDAAGTVGEDDVIPTATDQNTDDYNLNEIKDFAGGDEKPHNPYDYGEEMVKDVTAIYDIPVQISAVLGRSQMQVSQLLKLGRGAVVELDRKVGEAIDVYVNNRLVARGEVVVVEDKLGITMTEIVKSDRGGQEF